MYRILLSILIIIAFFSCNKEEVDTYETADNVYFDFDPRTRDRDSIVYTFAYTPGLEKDTVFLPIRISGIRTGEQRTFGLKALQNRTTAISGQHYEELQQQYVIGADSGAARLPIILFNNDPLLSERSVVLTLQLTPGDLGTADTSIITAKIVFSNKLEKPIWWEMWLGPYYSQVKHELFLISSGTKDLTLSGLDAPKNLYHTGKLASFLNDPFTWVNANPEAGYVLAALEDGNYDFYNINIPAKKILLRKNEQANKYFFIDENGVEVN